MQRVDGYYLYRVGTQLHPLDALEWNTSEGRKASTFGEAGIRLHVADGALESFLRVSVFQLKTSLAAGERLLAAIRAAKIKAFDSENDKVPMPFSEVYAITSGLREFEIVLNAELALMPLYVVTQKAGYDTAILISAGSRCFPAEIAIKAPEAIPDIEQATKCIAFELFTAAGFHLHRANESVLRRYWDAVSSGAPRPANRNMGDYLKGLENNDWGDKRTRAALRDLKDLDRNPLIHPEYSVENLDTAIALMNSIHGAMTKMLAEMPVVAEPQLIPAGAVAGP